MSSKLISIGIILLLIIAIGTGVVLLNQPQIPLKSKADVGKALPNQDSCGLTQIDVREIQTCPRLSKTDQTPGCTTVVPIHSGQTNNVPTYTNIYTLKNVAQDKKPHVVKYSTYSSFCTSSYGHLYASKCWIVCSDNLLKKNGEVTIQPGQSVEVEVKRSSPTGNACGTYQLDFDILSVDQNTNCIYRGYNPGETVGAWGFCETGITCAAITPTPIPTTCPLPVSVKNLQIICQAC